jgi:hypothetical protein
MILALDRKKRREGFQASKSIHACTCTILHSSSVSFCDGGLMHVSSHERYIGHT